MLIAALAPALVVLALHRRRRRSFPAAEYAAVGPATRTAWWLCLVAALAAVLFVVSWIPAAYDTFPTVAQDAVNAAAAAAVVAVLVAPMLRGSRRRRALIVGAYVLFAGALALATTLKMRVDLGSLPGVAPSLALVAALVIVGLSSSAILAAAGASVVSRRFPRSAVLAFSVVLGAVIAVQWVVSTLSFQDAAAAGYETTWFDDTPVPHGLGYLATTFPAALLYEVLWVLPLVLLPALLRVVRAGSEQPARAIIGIDSAAGRAVVLIFALYVCGTTGSLFGFGVPLPVITGGVGLWAWLRWGPGPSNGTDDGGVGITREAPITGARDNLRGRSGTAGATAGAPSRRASR